MNNPSSLLSPCKSLLTYYPQAAVYNYHQNWSFMLCVLYVGWAVCFSLMAEYRWTQGI